MSDEKREEFVQPSLTLERAARRFLQAQDIESTVRLIENSIAEVENQIDEARSRKKELNAQRNELLRQLRANARDEGALVGLDLAEKFPDSELPLIALMRELKGEANA